ncbi:prephenate dehydratase [Ihubacter sp. rT4E-8]|uniref:prephenate dehydratase n=1 Tax=Ihubacter sp. rT4E-8 TaxID=3242369 RepID=UPI003CEEF283
MSLEDYRSRIDAIDEEIVKKLEERMRIAENIAKYKQENGLQVMDVYREREKIDKITEIAADDMASYTRVLYNTIMELSKDHQRKITQTESPVVQSIKKALEETSKVFPAKATVACQGVAGAYSQQACEKLFKMPQIMYVKNFNGVFAAIDQGLCQYGVLPLENSTAGSVNQIYDLMMKYNFHIVKSVKMKIDHSLLAKPGTKKEDIQEIVSHEQAIQQCDEYLKKYPNVKVTMCENTAEAAKMVAESGRSDIAALASYACGQLYGLNCLEENVQDNGNNYTRFICISKKLEIYPGADKTSLMLVVSHKPGSLYNVLSRFNALGINIFKLESRPIPERDFDFMFYFDIDSEVYSEEFIRLMNQLDELTQQCKYLGSYTEI